MKKKRLDATGSCPPLRVRFEQGLDSLLSLVNEPESAKNGPWIAALSAGCDSTALCCLLREIERRAPIIALHVNHGLRGADSDGDEAAAGALAADLGFEFRSERLSPPAGLTAGATEAWARTERYRVLHEAALGLKAPLVLTAHNRNDQAETVLARFMRRAGYWGLAGIRPWRHLQWDSSVLVARPLLAFGRGELERYLADRGQPFRRDRTNEEILFGRNRIRLRLLPRLTQAEPGGEAGITATSCGITATLCDIADLSRAIHTSLDRAADSLIGHESGLQAPLARITCDLDRFVRWPDMMRFAFLRRAALRLAPRQVPIKQRTFRTINASVGDRSGSKQWALGRGLILRRTGNALVIEHDGEQDRLELPDQVILTVPGECTLPNGSRIRAAVHEDPANARQPRTSRSRTREIIDADQVGERLSIRTRRPGDTFAPIGAPGRKKLKSFLIDAKIPAEKRDSIPLVCHGNEIIWVAGVRIAQPVRLTAQTRRFLCLTYTALHRNGGAPCRNGARKAGN